MSSISGAMLWCGNNHFTSSSSLTPKLFLVISLALTFLTHASLAHEGHHEKASMGEAKRRLERFSSGNLQQEEHHIREHLENIAKIPEEEMTPDQRNFHFFYLHDLDGNTKLDGLEILKAIFHAEKKRKEKTEGGDKEGEGHGKDGHDEAEEVEDLGPFDESTFVDHIDRIMSENDKNDDGYVDYFEFMNLMEKNKEEAEKYKAEQEAEEAKKKQEV